MSDSGHGGAVAAGEIGLSPGGRRRGTPLLHLPTWSRLLIATKQRAPTGRGGDFFEVVQHRDGRVSIFMADVCGNGPLAAGPVQGMRWVLRQRLAHGDAPGLLLATLNDWLVQQKVDERFVTAVCVRIDPVTCGVDVACAGHLGPFVKRAAGHAETLPIAVGAALGIFPAQTYQEMSAALAPEDAIVLCTDGITDRMSTAGDPLGATGLLERLTRARHGAESICGALLRADAPTAEDATVIVVQLPRRHRRVTPGARVG
jgi:serine phosphatase RsbU (regulator of sigma subunit)